MSSMSRFFIHDSPARLARDEIIGAHRDRIALEEIERMRRRSLELEGQRSNLNPPDIRIRVWEKTHGLRLPSHSAHPILDVIARDTGLTRAEVDEELRVRLSAAPCAQGDASH